MKARRAFGTYQRALAFLLQQANHERTVPTRSDASIFGLDRIRALLAQVNNPHKKLRTVHIAGTKGKGSTATMLARMFQATGYRVGLYTSPHVEGLRERITVNGGMLNELQYGADKVVFTASDDPRSASPHCLADRYVEICGKMCQAADDLEQALAIARAGIGKGDLICITGSFSLIGRARTRFLRKHPKPFE